MCSDSGRGSFCEMCYIIGTSYFNSLQAMIKVNLPNLDKQTQEIESPQ